MDSRAKQRLTGAIILVALFVLLVPELLTGPRKGGADPPSEDGMRHYTIDLDAPAGGAPRTTPATPAPAVALPPVAENPASPADARAVPGEAAKPESTATSPASVAAAPRVATPPVVTPMATSPQPVASVSAQAPAPAAQKPAASPAPTNPVARTDTPRPASTPAASSRGGFAVQLGSFVSKENAERLVREMTAQGFNAFLAPPITTGGRELYRVRVGPTRDRAAAEALATQLRRMGHEGSVVANS